MLSEKLQASKDSHTPEITLAANHSEEEDESQIEKALKPHLEENQRLTDRNVELEQKLQMLLGEYAVMKSDSELIKSKARQLLIEKDKEIDRLKTLKRGGAEAEESKGKDTDTMGDSGASNFQETIDNVVATKQGRPSINEV